MMLASRVGYCLSKRPRNTLETDAAKSSSVTTSTASWPAVTQCTSKPPSGYSCVDRITKICRGNDCLPTGLTTLNFQPKPGDDASVQIRLLLPLSGYPVIEALQIPHNSESFLELPELVQTNLFTVVSLSAVRASAFALHEIDCVNQTYGPVDL